MAKVFVASRLPFGLLIEHPQDPNIKVELAGIPRSDSGRIITPYGETEVDKDFWDAWVEENQNFTAYKNGVIFATASKKDLALEAQHYEGKDALTGLEPIPQKVDGIKPADEK